MSREIKQINQTCHNKLNMSQSNNPSSVHKSIVLMVPLHYYCDWHFCTLVLIDDVNSEQG